MFNHYDDILSRIADPPRWFDEQGVPRYCDFAPDRIANIYAQECALLEIACQDCGRPFIVAVDQRGANAALADGRQASGLQKLADLIRSQIVEYGDPPNVECCRAGPTMTSVTRRVLEYWDRAGASDWKRDRNLEIEIGKD